MTAYLQNNDIVVPGLGKRFLAGVLGFGAAICRVGGFFHHLGLGLNTQRSFIGFKARKNDVFLASYPRSGTTWMQMILYQLITDGDMDFVHISQKSPWLERALSLPDYNLDVLPLPRIFKSHLRYEHMPRFPCKYIYICRNGVDVAKSIFHFRKRWDSLDEGFAAFIEGKG